MILIWFRYDLLLCFVSSLVMQLWFWWGFTYNFDMGQICVFDGSKVLFMFFWVFLWCVCVFFSYINKYIYIHIHIYIVWKHIKIISHQHRLKIAPKPYQNHIKIIWKHIKTTNTNHIKIKSKSLQHRIKTVSKPYQNHIQSISKPYLNHNPKFKAHQIHILTSYQNHIEKQFLNLASQRDFDVIRTQEI